MEIIKIIQAKEVFAPYFQAKLTPSLSYKIYKLCKSAEQEEIFYNDKRRALIEEYTQRNVTVWLGQRLLFRREYSFCAR